MKIMIVVGARPNFMKAAPIIAAIRKHNDETSRYNIGLPNQNLAEMIDPILVHTGQHYDKLMSDLFFQDLKLPAPDIYLGVGSASHAVQTAEIMRKFEEVLLREQPDVVVVVGDVNSTLACALVTAKIPFRPSGKRPLLAHVEAGLRSFDQSMPEEHNRVLTDHLADLLFVTEESGVKNLRAEGIPIDRIFFVGNTLIDSLLTFKGKAAASTILDELHLRRHTNLGDSTDGIAWYAVLTLHRPSNVDDREAFLNILHGLEELASEYPVLFPAHPRTRKRIQEFSFEHYFVVPSLTISNHGIRVIDPLGYLDFLSLMKHAKLVVTDSGGIQEETTCLGIPCVTVRENTERPITVENGTNTVAGVSRTKIQDAICRQLSRTVKNSVPELWDGKAAERILAVLIGNGQFPR